MKYQILTFIGASCLVMPSFSYANDVETKAKTDKLQQRVEKTIQSEKGAKEVLLNVDVSPKIPEGAETVNLDQFDVNGDGALAKDEVGEKLFELFDQDGNDVIDNVEMKKPNIMVFVPTQKTTVEVIDYQEEDKPLKANVTHEEFLQTSQLSRFDGNADGLSPLDFLGLPFSEVNVKEDFVIDLAEWKRAYAESVKPEHIENYHYN